MARDFDPKKLLGSETAQGLRYHAFSGRPLGLYHEVVVALLRVKKACATSNEKSGTMSSTHRKRIHDAVDCLQPLARDVNVFSADVFQGGGGIGINVNINEAIQLCDRELCDQELLDMKNTINMSQSTADVCASAARIGLHNMMVPFEISILNASKSLKEKCRQEFSQTSFQARTCLQDAMLAKMDEFLFGWAAVMDEHGKVLAGLRGELLKINLGGTVIGSGEGASAKYRANILQDVCDEVGLNLRFVDDFFATAQFSTPLLRVGSEVNNLCMSVAKMCRDLRMLSSGPDHGFGELTLPKLIQGSSFFANKNNPTQPETFLQCAALVEGRCATMRAAANQSELNLNVFEPMVVFNLYEAIELTTHALNKLTDFCFSGLTLGPKGTRHA